MKYVIYCISALFFISFTGGCNNAEQIETSAEVAAAIAAVNADFMAAVASGDATAISNIYTENGQVLPPNSPIVEGRPAIESLFQSILDSGINGLVLETQEIKTFSNTAIEVGVATLSVGDGQVVDQSKYIVIWKKVGDQWYFHRDMFSSNNPVPPAAAE